MPKGGASAKEAAAAVAALHKSAGFKPLPADRVCLRDGDTHPKADDEDAGCMTVSAKNPKRVPVLDPDAKPLAAATGRPKAGDEIIAKIELWAQDNRFGKRINASLLGVQFVAEGKSIGGGSEPSADGFTAAKPELTEGDDDNEPPF